MNVMRKSRWILLSSVAALSIAASACVVESQDGSGGSSTGGSNTGGSGDGGAGRGGGRRGGRGGGGGGDDRNNNGIFRKKNQWFICYTKNKFCKNQN